MNVSPFPKLQRKPPVVASDSPKQFVAPPVAVQQEPSALRLWEKAKLIAAATFALAAIVCFTFRINLRHYHDTGLAQSGVAVSLLRANSSSNRLRPVSSHLTATDDSVAQRIQKAGVAEVSRLLPAAWAGDPQAQFRLGIAFEVDNAIEQSCIRAGNWMMKAAEQGYAPAEYNLALRYWDGDGVWANRTESLRWLKRAALHGDARAIALTSTAVTAE